MSRTMTLPNSLYIPSTLVSSVISDDPTLDNACRPLRVQNNIVKLRNCTFYGERGPVLLLCSVKVHYLRNSTMQAMGTMGKMCIDKY